MGVVKRVCIITNGYPTKDDPSFAFIRPVVSAMADAGIDCDVIAPQSIARVLLKGKARRKRIWKDVTKNGNVISVYQPYHISFLNRKIFGFNINTLLVNFSIKRAYKKLHEKPDLLYAHFWDKGIIAGVIGGKENIPVVVACGESRIWVQEKYTKKYIDNSLRNIKGIIFVSSKNKIESDQLGLTIYNPQMKILPNGYDANEFYYIPKQMARKRLGLPIDCTIGVFVGEFCERKGNKRVVEAARAIPDLKLILIGKGEKVPNNAQILFQGRCAHEEICGYLNSADFFVLPTLAEGCCNAIVEAIACGLPVISSNRSFNDDILNEKYSIRVNPESIDEIQIAMKKLVDSPERRESMSHAALS